MTAAPMVARFAQACAREGGAVEPVAGPFWGYEFVRNDGIVLIERREAERRIDTLRAQLEAAEAECARLKSAIDGLPDRIESTHLGDYGPDELAAFDSGYNEALKRAKNLIGRVAIDAARAEAQP